MSRRFFARPAAVAAFAVLGILAGCASPPPRPSFPDIRFTNEAPLRIDAATIEVVTDFKPSFKPPEVEHLFPVPPELAIENWVHDRLQATGSGRRVLVHIVDARVREVELPKTPGLRGAFTTDQAERYDGTVEVRIDLLNERGFPERTVTAKASRSQSVPEGITANQRDQAWYDMTRAMMSYIDQELEKQIRENFTFYVQ
ncbi:MAG: hypothetical protein JWL84_1329 [Rhodospirillales bacterium]|nr:hypothetical protein [Rhodospirillales bacterium]